MFVIYQADDEVIITTVKKETKMLKDFFHSECSGRKLKDYHRSTSRDSGCEVISRMFCP